ncbi:TetR/AcrR family transcriptional regulator [Nocardia panacis]|uniref:TetR/AcrR family transcriptional regulator n=1 Tax=Nocardia panacis TaxID=2340916 RepID=A0A3A4K7J9_9NOCA|nr:TetR/AcrR family transcriptional regulator [Nocardia panacis]RJO73492.1 TetR/AcrR family transcriptional regulator [Nocardia panacis]
MRRADLRENNRKALIAAAISDIAEYGYQQARLGDLAERAGLSTGAVYSIFGSKRGLLVAATKQLMLDFHDLLEPLTEPELTLAQVLRGYAAAMLGTAAAGERYAFEIETVAAALREPDLRAELESEVPHAIATLTRLLTDRRVEADDMRHTTAAEAARLAPAVHALLSGFAHQDVTVRTQADQEYAIESTLALTALIDRPSVN